MNARDALKLRDMLDSARLVQGFLDRKGIDAFRDDLLLPSAILYRLQVIGEAAHHVSDITRNHFAGSIDFKGIIGLRHVIVHGYDVIDLSEIWRIASEDVPVLAAVLERILADD